VLDLWHFSQSYLLFFDSSKMLNNKRLMVVAMNLQRGWPIRYEELLRDWNLGMEYPMKLIEKKRKGL